MPCRTVRWAQAAARPPPPPLHSCTALTITTSNTTLLVLLRQALERLAAGLAVGAAGVLAAAASTSGSKAGAFEGPVWNSNTVDLIRWVPGRVGVGQGGPVRGGVGRGWEQSGAGRRRERGSSRAWGRRNPCE